MPAFFLNRLPTGITADRIANLNAGQGRMGVNIFDRTFLFVQDLSQLHLLKAPYTL